MPKEMRALSDDFCKHLRLMGTKPTIKEFASYARRTGRGYSSGMLSRLKEGDPVDGKFCRVLVELRQELGQEPLRDAFTNFLQSRSIDAATASDDVILNHICKPAGEEESDHIAAGIRAIGLLFDTQRPLENICRPPKTEREARQAVRWQYGDCGRLLAHDPHLRLDRAIEMTEAMANFALSDHQGLAFRLSSRVDSRMLMMVMGDKRPIGMSMALPLREEVWWEIRSGHRRDNSLTPYDCTVPSNFLFQQMLAQRPIEDGGEAKAYTRWGVVTLLRQYGTLANVENPLRADLHFLSLATNSVSRDRLIGFVFTPVGTKMPVSNVALYEKHIRHQGLPQLSLDGYHVMLMSTLRDPSM